MIDLSVALVIGGSFIQAAPPTTRIVRALLARRDRRDRRDRRAIADAELARDPLMTGIAGVARIYDCA